jgi:hypothetical protein
VIGVLALMEMGSVLISWMGNPVVLLVAGLVAVGLVLAMSRPQQPADRSRPSS